MTDKRKHHQRIEYEPKADATSVYKGYRIYVYDVEDEIVPDIILTRAEGNEHFRLWGYQGHNGLMVHVVTTDHKHPPDYDRPECKKWSIYENDGFPMMEDAPKTPDDVQDIVIQFSDAPVIDKAR